MSVRRLAPDSIQPASFAFDAANQAWVKAQVAKYPTGRQASAVIPLLWQAQKQHGGWLPKAAIEHVADVLSMPNIRVLEVATFYTMFNLEPVGQHFIQLCGTVPCHCMGAEDLKKVLKDKIGAERHVTSDGKFSWLEVECLGACTNAPMVQINDDYYEDLTTETLAKLIDDLGAGKPVKIGPQNGRKTSEPLGGPKTLQDAALYDGSGVGGWKKDFEARAAAAKKAKEEAAKAAEAVKAAAPAEVTPAKAAPAKAAAKVDEAALKAEEAEMAAKIAALPKDASAEQKADAVGARPKGLKAARKGKADDLKRIKGIGKVNEGKLNALGIFHFDQIAAWGRPEIRWVGTYLAFPGRIDREDWIAQATTLAAGGDTEFSKRVDKGAVPTSKA
ncbi:MAG TPA: NADH-quinone oxidoreductase subunit NuoE [Rhabdaerophilum sp.]|nr:NADH-quinone oxidoreductase subunit NuoE [Rhabdaerophilum sp.]